MFVTKLYYYHLSNQSIINLCQISTKVPKITYLLCRFSVYYHQALCLLWLWVYCYQNTKCAGDFKSIKQYKMKLLCLLLSCTIITYQISPLTTYVKYQLKSLRSHFYFAGFLCITYCLCAYYCWCWLLRIWFGKTSPAGHQ